MSRKPLDLFRGLVTGALLLRGGDTPDEVCERLARQNAGVLRWLGKSRQDEILQAGMRETGVDLSHWLAKEGQA